MSLVLDASVTLAWCFADETSASADRILDRLVHQRALVPPIWPYEVANALVVAERRKRLTARDTAAALDMLGRLPIDVDHSRTESVFGDLPTMARKYRLSAYDVSYLTLARREKLPLATLDAKLQHVAAKLDISVA